jgi:hypothetical protein
MAQAQVDEMKRLYSELKTPELPTPKVTKKRKALDIDGPMVDGTESEPLKKKATKTKVQLEGQDFNGDIKLKSSPKKRATKKQKDENFTNQLISGYPSCIVDLVNPIPKEKKPTQIQLLTDKVEAVEKQLEIIQLCFERSTAVHKDVKEEMIKEICNSINDTLTFLLVNNNK